MSGNVIGLAWIGVVCNNGFRYNVMENYSSNSNSLRVLSSHEIGHNFSAGHDGGSGFIMSPSVNNTTAWSSGSVANIESHYNSRLSCFTSCGSGGGGGGGGSAPDADFNFTITDPCATGEVIFTDNSSNNPDSWFWTFEGGNPSSSTARNPIVSYPQSGTFDVTLFVSNNDGDDQISSCLLYTSPSPRD